jgi:hypothetical protein
MTIDVKKRNKFYSKCAQMNQKSSNMGQIELERLGHKSFPKLACTAKSEALALIVGKRSPFESSGIK